MKIQTKFLALSCMCFSLVGVPHANASNDDSIVLARTATRCSVSYGMAAGLAKTEQAKAQHLRIQRLLILVGPKLGATRQMMDGWLAEFDVEFRAAMGWSNDGKAKNDNFLPTQANICEELLQENGARFDALLAK